MPLEHLPQALEGCTLLQISDIHVGPRVSSAYLLRALNAARELAPDFVAFTGDFVSYQSAHEYGELARVLKAFPHGRLATVAALGNHDYGPGWRHVDVADRITRVAEDAGAVVLRNEVRTMGGLQFAGMADLWSPEFGAFAETPLRLTPSQPTVVLAHNPDAQDLPIWDGVRGWVLAGHTHGGQVKPPFLPPLILPVRNKRYSSGEFVVARGRTLYINRGLGHLLQVRFNARPELTLFTLVRTPNDPAA
jgi:predicted MPP superfamily phosphohydrolase